jgi:hypothetical protein
LAHSSSVAPYLDAVTQVPKIMDFCDMDSQKWLEYARYKRFPWSVAYGLEGRKLEREERRIASRFDACTVATPAEASTLAGFGTGTAIDWFPNGVDSQYFAPAGTPYDPDALVFVGRMDYFPNVECMQRFCADVLPRVRSVRSTTTLTIVAPIRRAMPGGSGGCPASRSPGPCRTSALPPPCSGDGGASQTSRAARRTRSSRAWQRACRSSTSRLAAGGVDALADEHFLVADTPDDPCPRHRSLVERPRRAPTAGARRPCANALPPRLGSLDATPRWDHRAMRRSSCCQSGPERDGTERMDHEETDRGRAGRSAPAAVGRHGQPDGAARAAARRSRVSTSNWCR